MEKIQKNSAHTGQEYLHSLSYHPSGNIHPADWRNPNASITEQISATAKRQPDHLAAFDHENYLTYAELEERINQVANAILASRGYGSEVVGLLSGIDITSVIAALGIIKSGKIYVAVEETFPRQRMLDIFDDTGASLILSDELNYSR